MLGFFNADAFGGAKDIELKLEDFAKDWKANQQKALAKKYNGKFVTFTGPVAGFVAAGKDKARKVGVYVRCEPGPSPVRLGVYSKDTQPWTTYGIDQTIKVRGKMNFDSGAEVQGATITAVTKSATITLKSTELGAEATPDRNKAATKFLNKGAIITGEVVKFSDRKDAVYLKGKDAVLIECLMYPVEGAQLGASLAVGKEARIFGLIQEQLSPILDDSKNFRVRDCFPIVGPKKK
jgi:hypothetical protein